MNTGEVINSNSKSISLTINIIRMSIMRGPGNTGEYQ